ncbi:MAG: cbb3-type cytochrome oxidase assembly protein CcoS [Acidobacteriota bacterium]
MSVLYIAIPAALLLAIIGIVGFIWSVRGGQMDDLETPGIRPLLEDDPVERSTPDIQHPTPKNSDPETD